MTSNHEVYKSNSNKLKTTFYKFFLFETKIGNEYIHLPVKEKSALVFFKNFRFVDKSFISTYNANVRIYSLRQQ